MKASSMPTSTSPPATAPAPAPKARPASGTRKIRPSRRPQKPPQRAPGPVSDPSSRTFGLRRDAGQETTAASSTEMLPVSARARSRSTAWSAPPAVENVHTVSVFIAGLITVPSAAPIGNGGLRCPREDARTAHPADSGSGLQLGLAEDVPVHQERDQPEGDRQPEGGETVGQRRHQRLRPADAGQRERAREPGLHEAEAARRERDQAQHLRDAER